MMEITGATKAPAQAAPVASAASRHPKFSVFHLRVDPTGCFNAVVLVANAVSLVIFMMTNVQHGNTTPASTKLF
jgi:hypothetical protein